MTRLTHNLRSLPICLVLTLEVAALVVASTTNFFMPARATGTGNGNKASIKSGYVRTIVNIRPLTAVPESKLIASDASSSAQTPISALDPTFGNGGKVTTDFSGMLDEAQAIAIQPVDGKIVVAGNVNMNVNRAIGLIRYNPNGTLDGTFGIGGKVVTDFSGSEEAVLGMDIQTDGRIVAAGYAGGDFLIVRYNPSGTLDSSFGNGGKVVTDVSGSEYAVAIAIESGGKLVAAGVSRGNGAIIVARYNPNGSLDESFGSGGKVITDISGSTGASDVAIQPDGKVVVVATSYVTNIDSVFTLVRYTNNGALDSTFGNGGQVFTGFFGETVRALSIVIQIDGKLVVAGECFNGSNLDFALARYDRNGALDDSFGSGGKVNTDFGGREDGAAAVALQGDRIVVTGTTGNDASTVDFAVACYNTHGALDSSFGLGGKATTDFFDNFDEALAVAIQPDGKIVLAGRAVHPTDAGDFALARYIGGVVDTTPPVLTLPSPITVTATSPSGAAVSFSVTAADNVDPNPSVVSVPASGSLFPIGTTTVHSTATDFSGNSASATFTVNVMEAPSTPTPTPNPCVGPPVPPTTGTLRKSVALGAAPARNPAEFGKEQDLLYKYKSSESLCPTDPSQLEGQDLLDWNQSNIGLLKESGTTWVKLWVDWATLEPYSPAQLLAMSNDARTEVRDYADAVKGRKEAILKNLDMQIRTAHKEKLQVILTIHHSYPLWASYANPNLHLPLPPNPSRDALVPGCDALCKIAHDRKRRDPFAKVPMDLGITGPWAVWIRALVERYGLTKAKIDSSREICSQNFLEPGCSDYLNYVDFLEIVNEPNYTLWPQRSPDKKSGRMVIARDVAQMFRTSKTILEWLNLILIEHGQLDGGATTLNLLGPATADYTITNYRRTSYDEFNSELLRHLQGFTPGRNFGWSHHNYGDVEGANGYANKFGRTKSNANSTAGTRRLMVGKWAGWPSGNRQNPEILITESGARLDVVAKKWKLSLSNVPILKFQQASLVGENFNQMDKSSLGKGVAMVNNYLTYTDPAYDTGLLDFRGTLADWQRRACGVNRVTQQPIACRTDTGLNGDRRLVYSVWKAVRPSR